MVALWEAYRTDENLAWDSLPFGDRPAAVNPALDYAVFCKERENNHVVRTETRVVFGDEDRINQRLKGSVSRQINTSFVERFNGTLRLSDANLIRKSQHFAKNIEYFRARISLFIAYYNFVRPHGTLTKRKGKPITPAMAAGILKQPIDIKELLQTPIPLR